jgi:hypothetical protein
MSLNPKRTVAELKELRSLTADENGAQCVAWTDTWLDARQKNSPNFPPNTTTMRPETAGQPCAVFRRNVYLLAGTWTPFLTVVLAAEEGYLSLDDDVRKLIPELPNYGHTMASFQSSCTSRLI